MIRKYSSIFSYCMTLALLFACMACSDDEHQETPYLSISEEYLEQHFVADISVVKIPVRTNLESNEWSVTSNADWCIGTKAYGAEYEGVSIVADRSEEPEMRTAVVTVKAKTGEVKITVTQLGSGPAILVKNSSVTVPHEGGEVVLEVTSNVEYEYTIDEKADWLTKATPVKSLVDSDVLFVADKNKSYSKRTAGVVFKAKDYTDVMVNCEVTQEASPPDPTTGVQLKVVSGLASECQPGYELEKSFDGLFDPESHYHSDWNNTQLPVTLEYFFDGEEDLNYAVYHSRSGNGNFGKYDVYVQSKGGEEVFDHSRDLEGKGGKHILLLEKTYVNVEKVKFVVHGGTSNVVSCVEMEFFRHKRESELD